MHSGGDTLKNILQQRDRRHAEGVIVKSAFFFPPSRFRNPSSLMLAMALEPGQRKGGRKKRRRGLSSPYAIWFSACLTDFCSFNWTRVTNKSAFPQKYCAYKLHIQAFSSLLPEWTQKQWWIKPNSFVSLFKWFCQWMALWHPSSQWCIQIATHPITDSSELLPFSH